MEPQRSNLVTFSENFDNAAWVKSTTTVTANAQVSPDGYTNAETMTVSTSASIVEQTMSLGAGTYTFSVYVKVISQTTAGQMRLQGLVDAANVSVNFTPTTEWQRFTATYTPTATLTSVRVRGQSFVGTLAVWGAQLEVGAYATSYIPTLSASVTRVADAASKTGISSLIGQTEGTVFLEVDYSTLSGLSMFLSIRPNASNKVEVYRDGANIYGEITGSSNFAIFTSKAVGAHKIGFAYKSGSSALYIDGALVGQSTTAFTFSATLADLFLNQRNANLFVEAANYKQALLFKTRLSNAALQELTTL